MSWLFSQALVEEYSAVTCSDGEPSALLSGNRTHQAYCAPDKMTDFSRLSRFGMTYKPLTEDRGEELLTSYLAAFRAKTLAQPEKVVALKVPAAACGRTWHESSVRYCLDSSSWKTAHCLWEEVLPWSSVTLPRWGMTRSGVVLAHQMSERPINATAYGLWPTPCKTDGMIGWSETVVKRRETTGLRPSGCKIGYQINYVRQTSPYVMKDGRYHPKLGEWLNGWPQGWSQLQPLETGRFQEWLQQHSLCYPANKEAA